MAYGFNLGQIEGLDSSVKTVELAIEREGQALSLTLAYDEGDGWWSDGTGQFVLRFDDTTALLWIVNATESNVGDVYNITLSTEDIEPNFKAAVEDVVSERLLPENPEDGTIMTVKDGQWIAITENYYTEDARDKRYSNLIPQEVTLNNIYAEIISKRDYDPVLRNLIITKNGYENASVPSLAFKNSDKGNEGQTFKTIVWTCVDRTNDKYSCSSEYTPFPRVNKYYKTPATVDTAILNALLANATTIISSASTVKTSIDVTDSDFISDMTNLHSALSGNDRTFYPEAPIRGISIIGILGYCTRTNDVSLGGKILTTTQAIVNFSGTWLKMIIALEILSDKISIHVFTDKV